MRALGLESSKRYVERDIWGHSSMSMMRYQVRPEVFLSPRKLYHKGGKLECYEDHQAVVTKLEPH